MDQDGGKTGGAIGIWFNKRSVSRFEIPVQHELSPQPAGWRLDVIAPGKLVFVVDHERVPVDLDPGDFVLASGDDLYVSLQQRRDRPRAEREANAAQKEA